MAKAAKKTTKTRSFPDQKQVFKALFDMIAEKGLGRARLSDLAPKLKVSVTELYQRYPKVDAILNEFSDYVDAEMLKNANPSADKREAYFDMMMARLDVLQTYRAGVVRWLQDLMKQPTLWATTLHRWEQSLSLMLDVAKDSPLFPVKKIGLAAVYVNTVRVWIKDDSTDMAKTMATLDGALAKAESFTERYLTPKKKAA